MFWSSFTISLLVKIPPPLMLVESQTLLAHKLDHLVFDFSSEYFWLGKCLEDYEFEQSDRLVYLRSECWKSEFQPNQECRFSNLYSRGYIAKYIIPIFKTYLTINYRVALVKTHYCASLICRLVCPKLFFCKQLSLLVNKWGQRTTKTAIKIFLTL